MAVMHPLERAFLIESKRLWNPGDALLAAVSGGADSMALLALMTALGEVWPTAVKAVHVDHGLRPESGREAAWVVTTVAARLGLLVRVVTVRVEPARGESLEMAARRVRYEALTAEAGALGPRVPIVVAHHRADQAETVLMRILTGTGIEGLRGMRPVAGRVLRPLLRFEPETLRDYLRSRNIPWIEDPSNQDRRWLRNRLRHDIMPLLQATVNPRVRDALAGLAERADEAYGLIREQADAYLSAHGLDAAQDPFIMPPLANRLPPVVLSDILGRVARIRGVRLDRRHRQDGLEHWPRNWRLVREQDGGIRVTRERGAQSWGNRPWAVSPGRTRWGNGWIEVTQHIFGDPPQSGMTYIGLGAWPHPWVRAWRPGDRIRPLGLQGHTKKLQDVFVDRKVPRALRAGWPIVVGGPEVGAPILAVAGLVVAEDARAEVGRPAWIIKFEPVCESPADRRPVL
ncbi:MAG: tRNA lysidine(34) synthetase TilS [Thermaerobacter sp.]|nr:tRNA lysidine(34) synthetase TilS [Thermaerobacter sp.]